MPCFDIQKQVKLEILRHMLVTVDDLKDLLTFTVSDLEKQLEEQEGDSLNVSNSKVESAVSSKITPKLDFDTLLEIPSMKKLKKIATEKQYLQEKSQLLPKLQEYITDLDFQFRKDDQVRLTLDHLASKLEPNLTPDLARKFVRIQNPDTVYYGQVNEDNQMHGIGTLLYDNGFMYQGMMF